MADQKQKANRKIGGGKKKRYRGNVIFHLQSLRLMRLKTRSAAGKKDDTARRAKGREE